MLFQVELYIFIGNIDNPFLEITLSDSLLLICKNAADFCVLPICPETLLNLSFIYCNNISD